MPGRHRIFRWLPRLREAGWGRYAALEVEVVFGQLLVETALFQQVVDQATFGQIGLGDLHDRRFGGVLCVIGGEVVFEIDIVFTTHDSYSRQATRAICAPYIDNSGVGKKDFFNQEFRES